MNNNKHGVMEGTYTIYISIGSSTWIILLDSLIVCNTTHVQHLCCKYLLFVALVSFFVSLFHLFVCLLYLCICLFVALVSFVS